MPASSNPGVNQEQIFKRNWPDAQKPARTVKERREESKDSKGRFAMNGFKTVFETSVVSNSF